MTGRPEQRKAAPGQGTTRLWQVQGTLRPCAPAVPPRSRGDQLLSGHTWGRPTPAAPPPPPAPLGAQETAHPRTHRDSRPMLPVTRSSAPWETMRRLDKRTKEGGAKPSRCRARTGPTHWTELRQGRPSECGQRKQDVLAPARKKAEAEGSSCFPTAPPTGWRPRDTGCACSGPRRDSPCNLDDAMEWYLSQVSPARNL